MLYQESDLDVIVGGERTVAEGLGAQWVDGEGIKATRRAGVDEVWNLPKGMALPFPFTVEQFRAFCDWHPTFEWEAIQGPYTNDDDTPDDAALAELAARGTDAAELVLHMLGGLGDKGVANTDKPKGLTETQPIQRSAAQDTAILEVIKTIGHDPLHLPRNEAGKPGVKAKVREAVGKNKLFTGSTVFEKAWERLTASHDIVIDKVSP